MDSDKSICAELVQAWGFARDQGKWDDLAAIFHPGGEIAVSWFRGPYPEFVAHCRRSFEGKTFSQLDAAAQDKVLHGLEKGEIELQGASAAEFFTMLWANTQEGFLADPMYGGNRDFAGWKLIGFPGPRYNYVAEIEHHGKRYGEPTVGLLGRDPDRRGSA